MRKSLIILLIVCAWANSSHAQINLVYNPSFEEHWRCPQFIDLVKYANYWTAIEDTTVSDTDTIGFPPFLTDCKPEYCNRCSSNFDVSVPSAFRYNHYPRTGDGMMQLITYYIELDTNNNQKRDYLQGRLKEGLVAGEQYCVVFHVLLTGASVYGINHIGAYFDDATIDTSTDCGRVQNMYIPQVVEPEIINDTSNWTEVKGIFSATGGERFITIGNFFDANHTDTLATHFSHAASIPSYFSWHLIDDVSVIKVGTVAYAGNDTTIDIGDTVWVGNHDGYLPVKWYSNGVLIDSNHPGFAVHPDSTTSYVMELDVCGTITYDTMTVTVKPVGIRSVSLSYVKVYPNPVKDEVFVSGVEKGITYRLLNTLGVCLKQGELNSGTIGVSDLPIGMYMLELSSSTDRRNFKVMKL